MLSFITVKGLDFCHLQYNRPDVIASITAICIPLHASQVRFLFHRFYDGWITFKLVELSNVPHRKGKKYWSMR